MAELTTTEAVAVSSTTRADGAGTAGLLGAIFVLIQFDICEEIQLPRLSEIINARTVAQPKMKYPAPGYISYQRPPVAEALEPLVLDSGERLATEIKYYDYGVVSVVFQLPFAGDWDKLVTLASRWVSDVDFSARAAEIVKERLKRAEGSGRSPFIKPYPQWLSEDYFVFHLREIAGVNTAAELLERHGPLVAGIVRGESTRLADSENNEVLQSRISFYPNDVAVIGWNAAFLYDTPAGAQMALQLLEYANSQLLEFRHYDELLTRELEVVYDALERGNGMLRRWRMASSANALYSKLLDVMELTEHADNAIKFLSDMFAARLYRLAAAKIGVPDYKNLVTQKLRTADDLYRFMVDQFNQSRAFLLEFTVVIILVIELIFLFRGKVI